MALRSLAAAVLAATLAATLAAAQTSTGEGVIIVPVEDAPAAGAGMGGFTAAQSGLVIGSVVFLGIALAAGGDGDGDDSPSTGTD